MPCSLLMFCTSCIPIIKEGRRFGFSIAAFKGIIYVFFLSTYLRIVRRWYSFWSRTMERCLKVILIMFSWAYSGMGIPVQQKEHMTVAAALLFGKPNRYYGFAHREVG